MLTQQTQLKVNLPVALYEYLASKAQKFDMPIAGYIKHLILNDVKDVAYPTFRISQASEEKARVALKEQEKAVKVTDVAAYFQSE